jgi:hypothetical protein
MRLLGSHLDISAATIRGLSIEIAFTKYTTYIILPGYEFHLSVPLLYCRLIQTASVTAV